MRSDWSTWIHNNWSALNAGTKLIVPESLLGHPSQRPDLFRAVDGYPDGQTCDWAFALRDGKRVHVQCYRRPDGERLLRVHIDKWDPNHSLGNFVMHALFETPVGPLLGLALLVGAIGTSASAR